MPSPQPAPDAPGSESRARRVELILMDVDGVLTDGRILLVPDGRGGALEVKAFDVQDGVGITFVHRVGLRTGIITGRTSESVAARDISPTLRLLLRRTGRRYKIPGTW